MEFYKRKNFQIVSYFLSFSINFLNYGKIKNMIAVIISRI